MTCLSLNRKQSAALIKRFSDNGEPPVLTKRASPPHHKLPLRLQTPPSTPTQVRKLPSSITCSAGVYLNKMAAKGSTIQTLKSNIRPGKNKQKERRGEEREERRGEKEGRMEKERVEKREKEIKNLSRARMRAQSITRSLWETGVLSPGACLPR